MTAVTWSTTDKDSAWSLSGGDLTATLTTSSTWYTVRATQGMDALSKGGTYFEVVLTSAWTYLMVGVSDTAAGLTASYSSSKSAYVYSTASVFAGSPIYTAGVFGFGTNGDRLGFLVRDGFMYVSKNGTWQNSATPSTSTHGVFFQKMTGTVYPSMVGNLGTSAVLCAKAADIVGSIPTGAALLESTFSLTTTLVDASGSPLASTSVGWTVFSAATPSSLALVDRAGSGTTDASGVITITYTGTGIAAGATCGILFSTTAGTADANCRSCYIARAPTIT